MTNPYLAGLELVKQHSGTSGQTALAKCILSLYNSRNAFSIADILGPLDDRYKTVVLNMVTEYARHGETEELCMAGDYVAKDFPGLVDLADAMAVASDAVHCEWARQREAELKRLYPDG